MTKRMLIDTTHAEETRVVVLDGNRLDDYDVETSAKKQLKGNIYLAKIVRIEPSLQAAFVEYGGNRHGFLAFSEIHPDYYQIPVADRERLIALQEEEARAEEARADREEEAGESPAGHGAGRTGGASIEPFADEGGQPDLPATALGIESESRHEAFGADGNGAFDAAEGQSGDGPTGDTDLDDGLAGDGQGGDGQAGDAPERDEPDEADEPVPETVGGESADDGQAQRRTARFLRQYKIQEVMRRRQILLIQVVKEERGNKGAALTTYISLAGRFSVLMPNSLRGGGVSRKITSAADRRRLKEITAELEIPRGMAMIVRTAGAQRPRPEIKRDCEYLLRTWDDIRETTLASTAPCLVYEEASLIKRAIRDVYTRDIEEIVVDGEPGWKGAREFMRMLMPSNAAKVNLWRDNAQKLFSHYQVEHHLDAMLQPTVQLRSGGYLVINQTEALVAIDVNSGRSTRERGIEETALRTNIEAADEVARQLRLRDLAGLIVIDFIDMEARRNNAMVERRLKDALRNDRARIQVGSISHFGLMEMSRQRLRPSIAESSFVPCPHCAGSGFMRGIESSALHVLRAIEEEAGRRKAGEILVHAASPVALYVLNNKRAWLGEIESRHHLTVHLAGDDSLIPPALRIEKVRPWVGPAAEPAMPTSVTRIPIEAGPVVDVADVEEVWDDEPVPAARPAQANGADRPAGESAAEAAEAERRGKRRRRRRRGGRREDGSAMPESGAQADLGIDDEAEVDAQPGEQGETAAPSLSAGESLESPSVFDTAEPDQVVAPVVAESEPGEGAPRGRRRRGGGRNRPRPDAMADAVDDVPEVRAPRAYNGPTPADPFAGSFDIFEMIERDADESQTMVNPTASAASVEARAAEPKPAAVPEAAFEAVPEPAAELVTESAADPVPEQPGVPETAAEAVTVAAEPVQEPASEPVAAAAATPEPAAVAPVEAAAEAAAEVSAEGVAPDAKAAKPARVAKPRKPRASRARKPAAAAEEAPLLEPAETAPAVEPAAIEPAPVEEAAAPAVEAAEAAPAPAPAPAEVAVPEVAPATAAPEAAPDAATLDPSVVRPIVIGTDTPAAARRTGWWKR